MMWIQRSEDDPTLKAPPSTQACEQGPRNKYRKPSGDLRGAFTRYLQKIDAQGEPAPETFDELWVALRAAVIGQLKKSSLWWSPPSYLGIYGWRSWQEVNRKSGHTASALDELMVDCYSFIFLKRFRRLKAQALVKPEIDGLVMLYVRNFIFDRRKANDPVGFRIFETLRCALRQAVHSGEITVVSGDPKIRSDTVLAFRPARETSGSGSRRRDLGDIVRRWSDGLLPGIITATGEERREVVERLHHRVLELEAAGIRWFHFQHVADPFKRDVRARWAALLEQEGGECLRKENAEGMLSVVRLVHPDPPCENLDCFKKLNAQVANRLERIEVTAKTRRYLQALWGFLGTYACDVNMESLPSNRKVSTRLRIPRERLPGLYQTLGEIIR